MPRAWEHDDPGRRLSSLKFARYVFTGAGIWGLIVLAPLYWLIDLSGRQWPAPLNYPHFFYGFLAIAAAWQIAFLIIGSDPIRYRLMMIPCVLEKLGYVVTVAVLYNRSRISSEDASTAVPDFVLMLLFIAAFARTRPSPESRAPSRT